MHRYPKSLIWLVAGRQQELCEHCEQLVPTERVNEIEVTPQNEQMRQATMFLIGD